MTLFIRALSAILQIAGVAVFAVITIGAVPVHWVVWAVRR